MVAPPRSKMPVQSLAQPTYEITDADRARQKRIALAWQAYNGELDPPLKPMDDGTDDNVLTNRCQAIVDRGVDFLFGKELDIAVEKGAPTEAQDFLDTVWGRTEQRIPLLQELAMNGATAGSAFLRINPQPPVESEVSGTPPKQDFELTVVDPAIVVGIKTAPQNCNKVLLYCIQYSETETIDGVSREVFYREEMTANYPDPVPGKPAPTKPTSWSIQHWTHVSQKGAPPKLTDWTAAGAPIAWNYPFPPMFDCKNLPMPNSPWGKPDLTPDLIGLNKALNRLLSGINATEGLYGEPLLYAVDTGSSTIARKRGQVIELPLPTSKIEAVHIVSEVPAGLAFAADLRSDIDEQSGVPGVATGRISTMPRGNLSGIAIELLHSPITKKTDKKRCLYGELIIDVSQALLVLNGKSGDIKITLAWQDPLPKDDLQAIQGAVTKLELGMTKTTVLRGLGEDPDEEAKLRTSPTEIALNTDIQSAMPPGEPGAPLLPNQPPPAPVAPAAIGQAGKQP